MLKLIANLSLAAIVGFIIRQLLSAIFQTMLDPLADQFFIHAKAWGQKKGHPKRNALKCPDCDGYFRDLPN